MNTSAISDPVPANVPENLYIPPGALLVSLESFEGPLDLLLYLVRRQDFDILALPIAEIADQYMEYIVRAEKLQLEIASDYLLMAATLAEIKSRTLLPRPPNDDEEEDPRAELVRRLLEYQRFKDASEKIAALPRLERELVQVVVPSPEVKIRKVWPDVGIEDLVTALRDAMGRVELMRGHRVAREPLSVRERIGNILSLVSAREFVELGDCFTAEEGRGGIVVTLLALLELMRSHVVEVIQASMFGAIRIRRT